MDTTDIRFRIAAARRILYREGCDSNIGGHVSARADGRGRVLGHRPRVLRPDHPRPGRASSASTSQAREGEMAFSPAVNFHARIYETPPRRRGDRPPALALRVGALVDRPHDRHVQRRRRCCSTTTRRRSPTTACKPHLDVVDALGDKRVVLMKNHGAIVASQSLEQATIEAVDARAGAPATTSSARRPAAPRSSTPRCVAGRAAYQKYFLPNMWEANLERLRGLRPRPVRRDRLSLAGGERRC